MYSATSDNMHSPFSSIHYMHVTQKRQDTAFETVGLYGRLCSTSVYPAKGRPGSGTTKLDSGAQKRLIRSPIEDYRPCPQARARLARAAVVPQASVQASLQLGPLAIAQASVRHPWGLSRSRQFCTVFRIFIH